MADENADLLWRPLAGLAEKSNTELPHTSPSQLNESSKYYCNFFDVRFGMGGTAGVDCEVGG